jgi:hypothetical protein
MNIIITSPASGQHAPIGSDFRIMGTSTANAGSGCRVYIGWNGLKPYQLANAMGPNGDNDYSMWIFTFTSNYHTIAAGKNILTAELSCPVNNTVLTKNDNVIVTGIDSNPAGNNQRHSVSSSSGSSGGGSTLVISSGNGKPKPKPISDPGSGLGPCDLMLVDNHGNLISGNLISVSSSSGSSGGGGSSSGPSHDGGNGGTGHGHGNGGTGHGHGNGGTGHGHGKGGTSGSSGNGDTAGNGNGSTPCN